jgi:P2-related tail formation protein
MFDAIVGAATLPLFTVQKTTTMSTTLRTSKLINICTPSISYDEQVQAACSAFDRQMYAVIDDTWQIVFIPSIMHLTDGTLVDILAWQFNVDLYDPTRDLEFRKRLVQMSIEWHKTKGTVKLVEDVVNTYFPKGGATLEEWFDYYDPLPPNYPTEPGWHDRYRFRVAVDGDQIPVEDEIAVLRLIDRYKPVSRWCDGIVRPVVSTCYIGWAGGMLRFSTIESDYPQGFLFSDSEYGLTGPRSGAPGVPSLPFTVTLDPDAVLPNPVTVTPSELTHDGSFAPAHVTLSNTTRSATFTYTPHIIGIKRISCTNDGGLHDPREVFYFVFQRP